MRNIKLNRSVKIAVVGGVVGLGLAGSLLLGTAKRALCFLKGPCPGGLYECVKEDGTKSCDCGDKKEDIEVLLQPYQYSER
jgi:hypothetical protein